MTTPNTATGNLVTNKDEFDNHVGGLTDRHKADQIDLNPHLDGYSTVQQVLSNLVTVAYPPDINNATSTQKGVVKLGDGVSVLGDIAGSYDNLKVIALQHSKVSPLLASNGQVLTWSGSNNQWEPQDSLNFTPIADPVTPGSVQLGVSASVTDIGGVDGYGVKLIGLQGNTLNAYSPSAGEIIKFRGGEWQSSTIENNVASALQYLQYDSLSGWIAADLTPASSSVAGVTTLSNDLGGYPATPTVVSLTGTGASGYITVKSNDIMFGSTLTAPRVYQQSTTGTSAYNFTISAQSTSNVSGVGGLLALSGGDVTSTSGGIMSLYGGNESTLTGGAVSLFGGGGSSTSAGGAVTIRGGNVSSTGGGSISLSGGTQSSTTGGNVTLAGGGGNTTSQGGNITINAGKGGTVGGTGGTVIVSGGNSASYDGGKITFGSATSTTGGSITLSTGYVSGTPSNSGKISLSIGTSPYVELSTLSANRQVLSLLQGATITSTEIPSGDKVVYIADATAVPTSAPTSGSLLYSYAGKLYTYQSDGSNFPLEDGPNPSTLAITFSGINHSRSKYLAAERSTGTSGVVIFAKTIGVMNPPGPGDTKAIYMYGNLLGTRSSNGQIIRYTFDIGCESYNGSAASLVSSLFTSKGDNFTGGITAGPSVAINDDGTNQWVEITTGYKNGDPINWTINVELIENYP